jgi:ABC-type sugar transport system substrate-binding protein
MRALLFLLTTVLALGASRADAATVGIIAPDLTVEAYARAARAAQSAAQDKGWTVELRDLKQAPTAPADLAGGELEGLVLIALRPDAVADQLAPVRAAGVPIVTVLAGASSLAVFDVGVNQYAVGAETGAYLLGLLGYQGELVLLRADDDPTARARTRVVELMLQDVPSVHALAKLDRPAGEGWRDQLGQELAAKVPEAGQGRLAVWAATDEMALVAEAALRGLGLGRDRAMVVSVGGLQAAFDRIRDPEGLFAATAALPYELMGEAAMDVIDDLGAGTPREQIAVGPYLFIDSVLVDRTNVPAENELPW